MMGYASPLGYGLVDYRLYMPETWFEEGYADRRQKCLVPSGIRFKNKNTMLSEMINEAIASGVLPAKYVGVDSSYGTDSKFLDSLPDSIIYFADIRSNCLVFAERPTFSIPPYSGKGRKPTIEKPSSAPITVKKLIEQSPHSWEYVVLGIGAKGPIIVQDICLPVVEVRDDRPGKDVWLYARKMDDGSIKYALCNAPADATIADIRKPALMRWSIEQCFEECKGYLGMGHYETRSWVGWRRHMLLTLIAHLFIIKLRIELSKTPSTPNATPYIEKAVPLEEFVQAYEQMNEGKEIDHPDIMLMPSKPQQFMTIGMVQKLIVSVFPKIGLAVKEVSYRLYKAKSAFDSHSQATMHKILKLRASPCFLH